MSPTFSEPESRREALDATCLWRAGGRRGASRQEHAWCPIRHQGLYGNMLDVLPAYRISVARPAAENQMSTDDPDAANLTRIPRSAGAELAALGSIMTTHLSRVRIVRSPPCPAAQPSLRSTKSSGTAWTHGEERAADAASCAFQAGFQLVSGPRDMLAA